MAGGSPGPAGGPGQRWRQTALAARSGRDARLPARGHARRRSLERGRHPGLAGPGRRTAADPRPLGRGRQQEAGQDARAAQSPGWRGWPGRPAVRTGDASDGRGRCRRKRGRQRHRLAAVPGRTLAGRYLARPAPTRWPGPGRPRPGAQGQLAALPASGPALALPADPARAGRLPGRRHGAGQDSAGARAAAGATARADRHATPQPAGRTSLTAGQLGGRSRALCAGLAPADRPPFGAAGPRAARADGDAVGRIRPGDHQLRHAAAPADTRGDALAAGGARRSPGDQEPGQPADPAGQAAAGRFAHRADGHTGGKPAVRPVVDLRLHPPRLAWVGQGLQRLHQAPGRTAAIRCAAQAGAALHPAPAQDRQTGDRRPARQDRAQDLVPPQPGPDRPLPARGPGTGAGAGAHRRHRPQGPGAVLLDALQADL